MCGHQNFETAEIVGTKTNFSISATREGTEDEYKAMSSLIDSMEWTVNKNPLADNAIANGNFPEPLENKLAQTAKAMVLVLKKRNALGVRCCSQNITMRNLSTQCVFHCTVQAHIPARTLH